MRALISVYDKNGIEDFARQLHDLGIELVSSGGTASVIADAGIPVTDVADVTGFPSMLDHRVVTLHPKIHGGILANRREPSHLRDLEEHSIDLIDIVVVNVYPFTEDPSIEMIDIGGPTMIRGAAKNHDFVTVLVDPDDYSLVIDELKEAGAVSANLRKKLASKAFERCASYDAAVSEWLGSSTTSIDQDSSLPDSFVLPLNKVQDLRYGENPHQQGARYGISGKGSWLDSVEKLSGLDLSYLNFFDADAAWRLVNDLGDSPACVIVKHANPCGVSVNGDLSKAYADAFACDERSAFGGIVALNREVDLDTVEQMESAAQADVIIAPGYAEGVIDRLIAKRKNTRILVADFPENPEFHFRQISQSFLVQQNYSASNDPTSWNVVTKRQPSDNDLIDAAFAWKVCSYVSSNAIVLAKDSTAWGIGAGQQNRVEAGEIAVKKAGGRASGGVCASDAFFPFADGLEIAAEAGVSVVVQPGGSVNDDAVIEAADKHDLVMLFTGQRLFRH